MKDYQMEFIRREMETFTSGDLWEVFADANALPHVLVIDKQTGEIVFETHAGIANVYYNEREVLEAAIEKYGTAAFDEPETAEAVQRYWDAHIGVTLTEFAPHGQEAKQVTFKSAQMASVDEYTIMENVMDVTVAHFPTVCVIMYGTIADEDYRERLEEERARKQKYRCNLL